MYSIVRLIVWILVMIFLYEVIVQIVTFFGADGYLAKMYVFWFMVFGFLYAILPSKLN